MNALFRTSCLLFCGLALVIGSAHAGKSTYTLVGLPDVGWWYEGSAEFQTTGTSQHYYIVSTGKKYTLAECQAALDTAITTQVSLGNIYQRAWNCSRVNAIHVE